ncbi:PREDICTED: protein DETOXIFICATION 55-like [Nelumbo nucifera]|uniref:Protein DETOXIFICATION n=1 Tax=Nelumbo nucifera TaxID=4432 RepID=A0A1U8APC1_NELNU|nr:PREDICTED: protein DETOXIFICATION 55-like [Nelumbo nucifera]
MLAEDQTQKKPTLPEVLEELKSIKDIAFPIAAMSLVGYLRNMISVVCMGRLGALELAGGALAIGFTNITGYSILSGLAMGMEPICSQAFGSRNLSLIALTLLRTILMLLVASIPIGLLWVNLEAIMLRLHQDPDIIQVASLYCHFALPDLILNSFLHPLRIYLRSKGTTWPLMWCALPAILLHLPITMFLAFTLRLGVAGIAGATVITNFNALVFLVSYILCTRTSGSIKEPIMYTPLFQPPPPPPPKSSLQGAVGGEWGKLIRLSLPSCLAVCLEWWWYELMTILAGYLYNPRVTLATSAIVIQTTSLMYTLPTALSASASTRVGNELGAGRASKARLATMVSMGLAVVFSTVSFVWCSVGREAWGRVFTQDGKVLELTVVVLPIIGLCELGNCPQTTGCGVLRGSARPIIGAAINFYAFYLVGLPVAMVFGFVLEIGFVGLCYGLLAAQFACALSIVAVICKTDWDRESSKARDLVGMDAACAQQDPTAKSQDEVEFLKIECETWMQIARDDATFIHISASPHAHLSVH